MAEIKRVEKLINKTQVEIDFEGDLLIISIYKKHVAVYSRQNLTVTQDATNEVNIKVEKE